MRYLLLVCYWAMMHHAPVYAQVKDIVPTAGITSTLHRNNIGHIYFTSKEIPLADIKATDFLTTKPVSITAK